MFESRNLYHLLEAQAAESSKAGAVTGEFKENFLKSS